MNFICAVKGVSASGKSSRVFQFYKFLEYTGVKAEEFYFTNKKGVRRYAGMFFPDVNILFVGKIYSSGEIERWQGYDAVTSSFVDSAGFSDFLKENSSKHCLIVEGAGVTQTHRLRPKFLYEFCGFENIYIQYYNFDQNQKQIYLDRVILRSGKPPGKNTMWEKAKAFEDEYPKSIKDKGELPDGVSCKVVYGEYNEDINDFGVNLLHFLGYDEDVIESFKKFVEDFDYVNKNKFENFQDLKIVSKEKVKKNTTVTSNTPKPKELKKELGSVFPVLAIDRNKIKWEEHLYTYTPVERIGDMYFKREDKFAPLGYGGINGGKLRQAIWLVNREIKNGNPVGLVSGASVKSPQLPMSSAVSIHYGLKSLHVIGATKPEIALRRDMVEMATWFDAKFDIIGCAFNPNLQSRVTELLKVKEDYFRLNYGISISEDDSDKDFEDFYYLGGNQVGNIPDHIENLIVPAGSYNSAISVLYGVSLKRPKNLTNIFLIGIGVKKFSFFNKRLERLKRITGLNTLNFNVQFGMNDEFKVYPEKDPVNIFYIDIHSIPKYDYQNDVKFKYEGVEFHPTYEGKMMDYIKSNLPEIINEKTCFWIVGGKPYLDNMLSVCPELGRKPEKINLYEKV